MSKKLNVHRIISFVTILMLFSLFMVVDVSPGYAVAITVDTSVDEVSDNGTCSLREAIKAVNGGSDYFGCVGGGSSSEISVPAGVFTINSRLPKIETEMTINGESAATTFLQASSCDPTVDSCVNDHQLFWVNASGTLKLNNLTMQKIKNIDDFNGGVIYNGGVLNVNNIMMISNVGKNGGAILNNGNLYVYNSSFYKVF